MSHTKAAVFQSCGELTLDTTKVLYQYFTKEHAESMWGAKFTDEKWEAFVRDRQSDFAAEIYCIMTDMPDDGDLFDTEEFHEAREAAEAPPPVVQPARPNWIDKWLGDGDRKITMYHNKHEPTIWNYYDKKKFSLKHKGDAGFLIIECKEGDFSEYDYDRNREEIRARANDKPEDPNDTAIGLDIQIRSCFEELDRDVTEDYFGADELKEFRRRIDELKRRRDMVVQIELPTLRVNGFEGILVELEELGEDIHEAL